MTGLVAGSTVYAWVADRAATLRRAADGATTTRSLGQAAAGIDRSLTHSLLGSVGRTLASWSRESWLYRWLTAEPDPDIVVIDLRETWTVGPLIAVLERVANTAGRYWDGATSRNAVERTTRLVQRLSQGSTAVSALAALFEPPEPPGSSETEDGDEFRESKE